jgi:transposase
MADGSWVGVDLHARSAVAGVLDGVSGELRVQRVSAASGPLVEWLRSLPAPVRVAYEAGPTGYGLARACERAGIACLVAAPAKIPRAAADRVKTDRRDAERLVRLLRLGGWWRCGCRTSWRRRCVTSCGRVRTRVRI